MSFEAWLAFCVTETVLCFTPGPAVLFVVSSSLARGMRGGFSGAVGILAGNALYFALSASGIAAVLVASYEVFAALKWAGALYLIYIGLRMLVLRRNATPEAVPGKVERTFLHGFLVQTANPKALIFFAALLPQFIDPDHRVALQVFVLGASSIMIELLVLTLYVFVAVRARRLAGTELAIPLQRVGGAFLIAAGARLALLRAR